EVASQLEAYFAGDLKEFTVPLAPSGTPFQMAVWTELTKIPYGSTVSYGDIARVLGKRLVASRAVGLAHGSSPVSAIVPSPRASSATGSATSAPGSATPAAPAVGCAGVNQATSVTVRRTMHLVEPTRMGALSMTQRKTALVRALFGQFCNAVRHADTQKGTVA